MIQKGTVSFIPPGWYVLTETIMDAQRLCIAKHIAYFETIYYCLCLTATCASIGTSAINPAILMQTWFLRSWCTLGMWEFHSNLSYPPVTWFYDPRPPIAARSYCGYERGSERMDISEGISNGDNQIPKKSTNPHALSPWRVLLIICAQKTSWKLPYCYWEVPMWILFPTLRGPTSWIKNHRLTERWDMGLIAWWIVCVQTWIIPGPCFIRAAVCSLTIYAWKLDQFTGPDDLMQIINTSTFAGPYDGLLYLKLFLREHKNQWYRNTFDLKTDYPLTWSTRWHSKHRDIYMIRELQLDGSIFKNGRGLGSNVSSWLSRHWIDVGMLKYPSTTMSSARTLEDLSTRRYPESIWKIEPMFSKKIDRAISTIFRCSLGPGANSPMVMGSSVILVTNGWDGLSTESSLLTWHCKISTTD